MSISSLKAAKRTTISLEIALFRQLTRRSQRHIHVLRLIIALDCQTNCAANLMLFDGVERVVGSFHRFAVNFHNDVAEDDFAGAIHSRWLDSGQGSRAVGIDAQN